MTADKTKYYLIAILAFLIYSCTAIFTKNAARHEFLSLQYILFVAGAVTVLGIYAIIWQQVIKKLPVSDAFMFKGTTIIYAMLIASLIFGESISAKNIIGSVLIIAGITIFARS